MKTASRAALYALFCLIGIFLGIWFDAVFHPNYMMVWLDSSNHLDLGPQQNDVVQWMTINLQNQPGPVAIKFSPGGSDANPCSTAGGVSTANGYCFVHYPYPSGTYGYDCIANGVKVCDPNYGPTSGSGGGTGTMGGKDGVKPGSRLNAFQILGPIAYISALLSNAAESRSAAGVGGPEAVAAKSGVTPVVGCDNANVTVSMNPIPASAGTIYFKSNFGPGTLNVMDPGKICSGGTTNPCTLNAALPANPALTVTVTYSKASCYNNSATVQINPAAIAAPSR